MPGPEVSNRLDSVLICGPVEIRPSGESKHPQANEIKQRYKRDKRPPSAVSRSTQNAGNRDANKNDKQQWHNDGHDPVPTARYWIAKAAANARHVHFVPLKAFILFPAELPLAHIGWAKQSAVNAEQHRTAACASSIGETEHKPV